MNRYREPHGMWEAGLNEGYAPSPRDRMSINKQLEREQQRQFVKGEPIKEDDDARGTSSEPKERQADCD